MSAPALRAGVVAQIAPKLLTPDPNNPRSVFDGDALDALTDSVKARGVLQPLIVRKGAKGSIVVQDGHRRLRAAKAAKLKTVPVLLAGETDAAVVRLDQLAANQLHEKLAPMDLARTLRRLREEQKLTPNDLAARMAKAGQPMTVKEIEASVALTDLPDWAGAMIDAGELEVDGATAILGAQQDPAVAKKLAADFRRQAGWGGSVDAKEARNLVTVAYLHAGVPLAQSWINNAPHFAWKTRCKGCEHLRVLAGETGSREAACMNRKLYDVHNAEAKDAGLGPMGAITAKAAAIAPEKLTPAQKRKVEKERAERREKQLAGRVANYLDTWLRARCADLIPKRPDISSRLVVWHAANRPDAGLIGNRHIPGEWDHVRKLVKALDRPGRLDEFLKADFDHERLHALAVAGLVVMTAGQVRDVAAALGVSLAVDFRADADYLALRTVEQLVEWLSLYGLDTAGKPGTLRQRLLDHPHTLEWSPKLAHMVAMQEAYAAPVRDEDEAKDDLADDDGDESDTPIDAED